MRLNLLAAGVVAASMALVGAGPAVAKTQKTTVHNFYVTNSLAEAKGNYAAFVDVDANSKKCTRKRTATLEFKGDKVGKDRTNSKGEGVVSTGSKKFRPGNYTIKIRKKSGCSSAKDNGKLTSAGFVN